MSYTNFLHFEPFLRIFISFWFGFNARLWTIRLEWHFLYDCSVDSSSTSLSRLHIHFSTLYMQKRTNLQYILIFAVLPECIFTPSSCPAPGPCVVRVGVRQTGGGNVGTANGVYGLCKSQDGDVIMQRSGIELRVDVDCRYVTFLVWVELDIMVHIPFTKPYPQIMPVVPATRIFAFWGAVQLWSLTQWELHKRKIVPVHTMKAYGWRLEV